jgi:hypothetical protein
MILKQHLSNEMRRMTGGFGNGIPQRFPNFSAGNAFSYRFPKAAHSKSSLEAMLFSQPHKKHGRA